MINKHNVVDFKNSSGFWVKSKTINGVVCHTRSSVLWSNIKKRTGAVGNYADKNKTYSGCGNKFIDYQHFAGWCQDKIGYMERDKSGNFWCLDKDIVGQGHYDPEYCVFIPHEINCLFTNNIKRGVLPLGVTKDRGAIRAKVGKQDLGYFKNPEDAHKAWQENKASQILELIAKWEGRLDERVGLMLSRKVNSLFDDLSSGRETSFL